MKSSIVSSIQRAARNQHNRIDSVRRPTSGLTTKQVSREGRSTLAGEKPMLEDGGIWFPISVENNYIEEDGLSLGLPVEEGSYSYITYERAVGVLAEDTHALIIENRKKPDRISLDHYVQFRTIENWSAPDLAPDKKTYFACWPEILKSRYHAVHEQHGVELRNKPVLTLLGSELYQDSTGLFARLMGMFNDRVVPVEFRENNNLDSLTKIVHAKQLELDEYRKKQDVIKANLTALRAIFGKQTQA